MGRAITAAAGVVLIFALVASGVLAGAKLSTKSKTVSIDADEYGSARATCKRGTRAVSGGFKMENDYVFDVVQSSATGRRTWKAESINFSGVERPWTSFAYCRDEQVRRRTATESVIPAAAANVTARCNRGEKAVSGGFDSEKLSDIAGSDGPYFQFAISRKAGPRGWKVRASNFGNETGELTAQVTCREDRGLSTRKTTRAPSDEPFSITAKCKRSQRLVSGGFAGPDIDNPEYLNPFASKKAGRRGWRLSGEANGLVTVYAYCE